MHLHRLEVEGFGPFRARQRVDFDAFADDGIFLIAGRTGAGKSSILDAVCFGLYGGVPRYDGGDKRLRSDHCEPDDPTSVLVEFSTVAGRYRVTRSPAYERPAKRGDGMTTQPSSVLLEQQVGDDWVGRAAKEREAAHELDEILQLSQEQFLQVILLAQNRFADFLLADSKERQALLRRLFGTERFSDYQTRFDERRRAAEQALAGRRATVDARLDEAERLTSEAALWGEDADVVADTTDDRIARLRRAITRADYQVERFAAERAAAEKALGEADAALAALKEQRQGQADRDRARSALAELEAQTKEITAAAGRRDRARAAEGLRALIITASRAAAAAEAAAQAEADAVRAATAVQVPVDRPDAQGPAVHYRSFAADRTRESGAWQRAEQLEATASARTKELADAETAESTASAALAAIEAERETLPERLAALASERDAARTAGALAESTAQAVAAAELRAAGARDAERLAASVTAAARSEAETGEAHARAQTELAALRRRRLDGYAGELADALVPGEACAVCGSIEHPSPAAHADPVSADDVAAAEAVRDAAARAEREATCALAAIRAEHAAAAERSGGLTAAQTAAALTEARAQQEKTVAAAQRGDALSRELDALTQTQKELEGRRTTASEAVNAARTAVTLVLQRNADADRLIVEARGDFATVAERAAEARQQIAAASAVAVAIDANLDAADRASLAQHEREKAIQGSVFDDVTAAEQALLSAAEIDALDERVTAHRVAREKERALLLDLELRVLPDEPIDLAPAQESAGAARAAWLRVVDDDSRARGIHSPASPRLWMPPRPSTPPRPRTWRSSRSSAVSLTRSRGAPATPAR